MSNTIDELYLKYVENVGRNLEDDRYFQYLYAMVDSSQNVFQHSRQVLHKVVDERWLSIIEESLDAINTIIEKPRRFVTTKEEVVPVALAKKITADSVRHLSMNTQFIASGSDGEIMPTRILNVSTEESFDLYENRFIYHLIHRLVTFIDKRTDVIFWSTGDEKCNYMSMTSKVDDAYEEIEYKIEMKIKDRKSVVENNTDNMSVFMRIDQVRRLVMALKNSSFCQLMAGCAKVHSPIQRTNLMMKDPHYRTCYKLWQFLESYDEVGYSIENVQTPLEFDEEYMIQMYTNLITNYAVFKSLLESDTRNIEAIGPQRRKNIRPKFIKQIHEEIVDNPNIPEVEIRKVFLNEVTEAQLAAEAEVERLSKELSEEKSARVSAESAVEETMQQVGMLMQQNIELQDTLAAETEAKENAEAERDQITAEAEEALNEAEAALAAEKQAAADEITRVKEASEAALAAEKQAAADEITRIKEASEAALEAEKKSAADEISRIKEASEAALEAEKKSVADEIGRIKEETEAALVAEKQSAADEITRIKEASEAALAAEKQSAADEIVRIKIEKDAELEAVKNTAETEKAALSSERDAAVIAVTEEKNKRIAELEAAGRAELEAMKAQLMMELERQKADMQKAFEEQLDKEMKAARKSILAEAERDNAELKTHLVAMKAAKESAELRLTKETARAEQYRALAERGQVSGNASPETTEVKGRKRFWGKRSK